MSIRRLAFLIGKLPDPEAGQAGRLLAKLILADYTIEKGVDSTTNKPQEEETAMTMLDRNSDSFLAIMRSLPENDPLKKAIEDLDTSITDVQENFQELSKQITDMLGTETSDDDINKLKNNSDFAMMADTVLSMSGELDAHKEFSATLKALASRHSDDEVKPVRHTLQDQKKLKAPAVELNEEEEEEE